MSRYVHFDMRRNAHVLIHASSASCVSLWVMRTCVFSRTYARKQIRVFSSVWTDSHVVHIHECMHACVCMFMCTHTTHTHTHTHTHKCVHTYTQAHVHGQVKAQALSDTCTRQHTQIHVRHAHGMHARTHARTHACTPMHMNTNISWLSSDYPRKLNTAVFSPV